VEFGSCEEKERQTFLVLLRRPDGPSKERTQRLEPALAMHFLIVFEKKVGNVLIRIKGDGALLIDRRSPIPILAEAHVETNKVYLPIYKSHSCLPCLLLFVSSPSGRFYLFFPAFDSSSFKGCLNFITFGW
jgi:hypothetical protein